LIVSFSRFASQYETREGRKLQPATADREDQGPAQLLPPDESAAKTALAELELAQ
jgi:hypothetical protein